MFGTHDDEGDSGRPKVLRGRSVIMLLLWISSCCVSNGERLET